MSRVDLGSASARPTTDPDARKSGKTCFWILRRLLRRAAAQPLVHAVDAVAMPQPVQRTGDQRDALQACETCSRRVSTRSRHHRCAAATLLAGKYVACPRRRFLAACKIHLQRNGAELLRQAPPRADLLP